MFLATFRDQRDPTQPDCTDGVVAPDPSMVAGERRRAARVALAR